MSAALSLSPSLPLSLVDGKTVVAAAAAFRRGEAAVKDVSRRA